MYIISQVHLRMPERPKVAYLGEACHPPPILPHPAICFTGWGRCRLAAVGFMLKYTQ